MPASRRRLPAVLFDLDGTLIDSTALILASARHAFDGVTRHSYTEAEWLTGMGMPLRTQLGRFAASEADVEPLTERYKAFQRRHHDDLVRAFDDVLATLDELRRRGHPMAIVTGKGGVMARHGLAHCGLDFDVIVAADDCVRHKPDPEPVLRALDLLGIAPEQAVFVGDSPHDMAAGNAAGVVTVGALWGPFAPGDLAAADHLLRRLADLPALLDRLPAAASALAVDEP
jgi:pyrophosphatase PpaX